MNSRGVFSLAIVAVLVFTITAGLPQGAAQQRSGQRNQKSRAKQKKGKKKEAPPLPSDKRLLSLHADFVNKAEKLAGEYERGKDWDKAKIVYREILKLTPQYPRAQAKLQEMLQREASADRKLFTVNADRDWQFTGVTVIEGKPVAIRSVGSWTFNLSLELGPEGIKIPKELKDYNLGCLIGAIDTGDSNAAKPFVVGEEKSFIAEQSGRLMLRMYDIDPKDNDGALKVEIRGSFRSR